MQGDHAWKHRMCCMVWYIIHGVSKVEFYRQAPYAKEGRQSCNHGNLGSKKPWETPRQATSIQATIIVPLTNTMSHKTSALPTGGKVVWINLLTRTKWKDLFMDVNLVGEKDGLEPILLSKLRAIKKINVNDYITKRYNDKFAWCSKCETLKCL